MGSLLGNSEPRSFANYSLPAKNLNAKCGFSEDGNTLVVITQAGNYFECDIPEGGGSLKAKTTHDLLNIKGSTI